MHGENHRGKTPSVEFNQASYSTKDPNNILSFKKKISQQEKCKAFRSKTHTKKNKSNQFYISKTSQDSLVSIH